MNQEEMISVILPVKNGDLGLLKRAIASVHAQTYEKFEILLIDDGSEPEYAEKLRNEAKEDPKVRLFTISPRGVSGARNFAIDQAQGQILTFLDSDDALPPACFEEAVSLLSDPGTDALWGGTCYVSEEQMRSLLSNGRSVLSLKELQEKTVDLSEERLHLTRAECVGEPFRFENDCYINRGIAARFIKKSCFEDGKNRFPLGIKMYEDAIWNLRMLTNVRVRYVKTLWYFYLNNDASVSNTFHQDAMERMEIPLGEIRNIMDLKDTEEYTAYTRLLMDSLRYVYKCLFGNPQWNAEKKERRKVKEHLYKQEPWNEIASDRFRNCAVGRDRQKALLYRMHLLFLYWKLTWNKM